MDAAVHALTVAMTGHDSLGQPVYVADILRDWGANVEECIVGEGGYVRLHGMPAWMGYRFEGEQVTFIGEAQVPLCSTTLVVFTEGALPYIEYCPPLGLPAD